MAIQNFEDVEGWQLARKLTNMIYDVATTGEFARDFGLKDQITRAAGSTMHNIAEGFDSGSNPEFVRFLRYSQRSCTEVKSQLYIALDRHYISESQFDELYTQANHTHAKVGGFIRYLLKNSQPGTKNEEPGTS